MKADAIVAFELPRKDELRAMVVWGNADHADNANQARIAPMPVTSTD